MWVKNIFTSEQLDQENCGSLVLLDENIFTSSYENQKALLHLKKKNKKLFCLAKIKIKYCCGHWSQ